MKSSLNICEERNDMSELEESAKVERIRKLSYDYEAQKTRSIILSGAGAAAAVVTAAAAVAFYAWSYYQSGIKIPEEIREELRATNAQIAALEQRISKQSKPLGNFVVSGNRMRCDVPWTDGSDANASIATCPDGSTLLSGGCDMTCLSMDHLSSIPNPPGQNANGWKCRHAPQEGHFLDDDKRANRTFSALALCQKQP